MSAIVDQYQFGLLGGQDHENASSVQVTSIDLMSGSTPALGGLNDLRMGTTDPFFRCTTCLHDSKSCPGHPGHAVLNTPVYSPLVIASLRRWLRATCGNCGEKRDASASYARLPPAKRLLAASLASKDGETCRNCGAKFLKILKSKEDHFSMLAESTGKDGTKVTVQLEPWTVYQWLERISDRTVLELGCPLDAGPRKLMLTTIGIPPNGVRPGMKSFGGGSNIVNDLTTFYRAILQRNSQIPVGPSTAASEAATVGALTVAQLYFDLLLGASANAAAQGNRGPRTTVMGGSAITSIGRGLTRKKGRIRGNLLAHRVFNISRTTISGNSRLRPNEVGIPLRFARTLQVAVRVQEFNREYLLSFFLNGRQRYPGCTRIVKRDSGHTYDIANIRSDFRLEVGDVLYRDVVTGDIACFNRQPTLERSSICAMDVVVIEDPATMTFQMNVIACAQFNADFDGDAMNLWVMHTPAARAEARILSRFVENFISTKSSSPVNGQVQDSVVGYGCLTRKSVRMDKWHGMMAFANTGVAPDFSKVTALTGRELVSMLLATRPVNYSRPSTAASSAVAPHIPSTEPRTVIERGVIKEGILDKRAVGPGAGGIAHRISREYGPQSAVEMIYAMQQLALDFMQVQGFSVGSGDLAVSQEALAAIREIVSGVIAEAQLITQRMIRGEIIPPIGMTVHDYYEKLMRNALKANDSELLRHVLKSMRFDTNGLFVMNITGAKGNNSNLLAITALISQVTINGERVGEQFSFGRTSPHFNRFSTDPAAYGFIANSYMSGMTATEFVFSAMNARFDLINKALTTASTGYFARKGVNSNQSILADNLRRCMKDNRVVQMIYGGDGLDARQLEVVPFRTAALSDEALEAKYSCARRGYRPRAGKGDASDTRDDRDTGDDRDASYASDDDRAADARMFARIRADRDEFRRSFMRIERANFRRTMGDTVWLSVNVEQLVEGALIAGRGATLPRGERLAEKIRRVEALCEVFPYMLINEIQERLRTPVPVHISAATALQEMVVRMSLAPPVLTRLSLAQIDGIIGQIRQRFTMSLIDLGAAVGVLASQALSEPLTQYMLDSHHRSVSGGTNKAGLIRVSEIFGACPVAKEKSSSMLLPLRAQYEGNVALAQEIANSIEHVTLRSFVQRHDILFEPYGALRYPPYAGDAAWIAEFERNHPIVAPPADLTNWCVRVVLDRATMVLKSISLERIVRQLRASLPGFFIVHTPESVRQIVLRAFARADVFRRGAAADRASAEAAADDFLDTSVRGIAGILTATVEKITRTRVAADGSLARVQVYAIATVGTNIEGVALNRYIEPTEIVSSSVGDTIKMFGILAGRNKIVSETRGFMEDNTPSLRHLHIYADEMTRLGTFTSIEASSLATREPANVLLRAGAAAPLQVISEAALTCARGKVSGLAAPLMVGGTPRIGSLYNSVVVDAAFVQANTKTVDSVIDSL